MCLSVPCRTLEDVLQAIIVHICNESIPELDLKCLPEVTTKQSLYQALIDKVCEVEEVVTPTATTYELCRYDTWNCGSTNCLDLSNSCGPTPTEAEVIQALIGRVNRQGMIITNLCDRLSTLESTVAALQIQVNGIKDCC